MEGEEEAAPRCACGTCSGLQPKSRHAVPLHKPFEVGKRTPKDKYDVKLADRLSFMCFRMPASAGQPGGWLPLSRRSREEIINCSSGLVHQGPEGRVGWSAGELIIKLQEGDGMASSSKQVFCPRWLPPLFLGLNYICTQE